MRLARSNTRSGVAAAWPRISVPSAPASVRGPSDAILAAAASIALRSPPASALRSDLLSATTFACCRDCASRSIWSSAAFHPGVSEVIWLSVVQRKVGTTLRRSNTFHWNNTSTVVITRKPSTTAIQSSVRHDRAAAVGAATLAAGTVLTVA